MLQKYIKANKKHCRLERMIFLKYSKTDVRNSPKIFLYSRYIPNHSIYVGNRDALAVLFQSLL